MAVLRLTFEEGTTVFGLAEEKSSLALTKVQQNPELVFHKVLYYRGLTREDYDPVRDRLLSFFFAEGYQLHFKSDLSNFENDLLAINPSALVVDIDKYQVGEIISTLKLNRENSFLKENLVPIAVSTGFANMPLINFWLTAGFSYILPSPPDPLTLASIIRAGLSLIKPTGGIATIPFSLSFETNLKNVLLSRDDFTKFSISVPEQVFYTVQLSVQGIPALSTSVPIPSSGVPPFEGVLKTNIGVATVEGKHVLSLVGTGGGLTKSTLITYQTN